MDAAPVTEPVPVLLPGNMCDERLWPAVVRAALPDAREADLTLDDTIDGMARRTLNDICGPLLPVGFSMGGIVALAMARLAPDRIAGMVLLDTNASADLPERAAMRPGQQAAVRDGHLERIVVEELKPNYLAPANRHNEAFRQLLRDMAMNLGDDVFVAQSEALRTRPDQRDVLLSLDAPVLIACGAQDQLCPPAWHETMAASAPRSTLHIVAGAGHMLPLEQPAALAKLIADWRHQ